MKFNAVMKENIIIGSRKSVLAMTQTEAVKNMLHSLGHNKINIKGIITEGDQRLDRQLADIGGKGLFLKELDKAMLDMKIDVSVHSMKDVPVDVEAGLIMACVPEREEVSDVFISLKYSSLEEMPANKTVATSSLRRQCLLNHYHKQIKTVTIRGNIHTRLKKLKDGEVDALVLAKAGLIRTNMLEIVTQELDKNLYIPAVGQGALAVYCREEDDYLKHELNKLNHADSRLCIDAERRVSFILNGGCHMPLAVNAFLEDDKIFINAMIGMPNGDNFITFQHSDKKENYLSVAEYVAQGLKNLGADKIIQALIN